MCGRFALTDDEAALMAFLGFSDGVAVVPRYNIAPTQPIAIMRVDNGKRQLTFARWGLVPAWVADPGTFSLLINARSDSVLDKPAFKNAMRYRRCLVPASGFYEWRRQGRAKQPFWIRRRDGGPMAFAGLWETLDDRYCGYIDSACSGTVDANATVRPIHDRMPAILRQQDEATWLDPAANDPKALTALLQPYKGSNLRAYKVSPKVNKPGIDDASCIAPLDGEKPPVIGQMGLGL